MDLQSPSSLITITVPIVIFFFFLYKFVMVGSKTQNTPQKMPPGPWKLPFIGSMLHLAGGSLPHRALRDLAKKHGPIMHLQFGEISTIIISSPRVASEVMKTHDTAFASRPELLLTKIVMYNSTDIGTAPCGDYWRQMRKICTLKLLSTKKIRSFSMIREEELRHLIESVRSASSSGSSINLSKNISLMINAIVCRATFGNRCKDQGALVEMIQQVLSLAGGFDVSDLFPSIKFLHIIGGLRPKLENLHNKLDQILNNIIENRTKNLEKRAKEGLSRGDTSEEDLLDVLLRLKESGELELCITLDNVKAVLLGMFIAGTDTSSAVIEWVMAELIRNPRVMKKAEAESRQALGRKELIHENEVEGLSYLKMVIKETLRLHPPVPLLLPRESTEPCKINGYDIPIKTNAIVNAWAINRDPEYWDDAESFKPERFEESSIDILGSNYEYLPFGAGRRMCPGYNFGLANVEFPLAQLLSQFNWKLPEPGDLDMTESFGATVKKKNDLYLIATPYIAT